MKLDFPPGLKPSYSNLGIGLLGRTLEEVLSTGQSWEDYVEKEILAPLGMKDSGTRMPPKSSTQMAVGYLWDGSVAGIPFSDYSVTTVKLTYGLVIPVANSFWIARITTP